MNKPTLSFHELVEKKKKKHRIEIKRQEMEVFKVLRALASFAPSFGVFLERGRVAKTGASIKETIRNHGVPLPLLTLKKMERKPSDRLICSQTV